MYKKQILLSMLILAITVQLGLADSVKFKSSSTDKDGKLLMLTGLLKKPTGNGPFPGVILLHGCAGINKERDNAWANRLVEWGYVVLQLDSFETRKLSNICVDVAQLFAMSFTRSQDAYDAKDYLANLPFVDLNRIALLGWSHGGMTVLTALSKKFDPQDRQSPFIAAIAFYPLCDTSLSNLNAPLLILIGEIDDWTPAKMCSAMMPAAQSGPEVILKIYHGAYHDFDWEGMDKSYAGHRLLYDPIADTDAIKKVKYFLTKYLQ